VPPDVDEPHAVVKVRRVFHSSPGAQRTTTILLNQDQVLERDEAASLDAPQTDAIRVHPGPGAWRIKAVFHHPETRTELEHYQEQVQYFENETYTEQQSYSCGTRTCFRPVTRSRMVSKLRYEPKTRWVTRTVDEVDDRCERSFRLNAVAGALYILQLTYTGTGFCNAVCLEQTPGAPDAQLRPCSGS
jgi:hypothetical protein